MAYCRPSVHEGDHDPPNRTLGQRGLYPLEPIPQEVVVPDERDPPGLQFYQMPVFKYEGFYIGQLAAYHTFPEEPHIRFFGTIDIQLAASRDGIGWERVGDRKPFIPNGPPASIDSGEVYMANAPVRVGDELWFYYSPCAIEHGPTGRSGPICLAKLRLDGFVSVDAGEDMGTLVTQPFTFEGDSLEINAQARGGLAAVAVLDRQGTQVPGFGKTDCAIFDSDSVRHTVTWRQVSIGSLKGKVIRLKFYLRNARLYSFRLTA